MNYEEIKKEFLKLKKEELEYIDNISIISINKILSEKEKIEIYRNFKNYEITLNELFKRLWIEMPKPEKLTKEILKEVIIEFDIDKDYLSKVHLPYQEYKKYLFESLGIDIETLKFKLTFYDLYRFKEYRGFNYDIILNNQKIIEKPIYIFCGYYDSSEECYGPCFGEPDDYLYGIYEKIYSKNDSQEKITKKNITEFEKNKIIVHSKKYIHSSEIKEIFKEELLNVNNNSINDCVIQTQNRIEHLNYVRSPEYKEKLLLERINKIYEKVKGEFIKKEILYNGNFLNIIKETYKLPNQNIVEKEKVIKNKGKDSVIIIAITQNKEFIITFQNRIKDKLLAEFPSGYIEFNEGPLIAAKRELQEETGYISDDLFIVDSCYTSPGIDNSTTYIVIANNCIKTEEIKLNSTELVNYGLFTEIELEYLINKNIINGAINKLAYYNYINNVDHCNYITNNKKIYTKFKKKHISL